MAIDLSNLENMFGGLGKSTDNGTSASDGGASVINTPTPKGPLAIPKLIRGEDGLMHTVYVDAYTGQQLSSLEGYSVLSGAGNYSAAPQGTGLGLPDWLSGLGSGGGGGSYGGPPARGFFNDDNDDEEGPMPSKSSLEAGGKNWKPGEYINKPDWIKYAAMLPGVGGKIAKVASTAANVNNVKAVNDSRKALGIDPLSTKDKIKGTLRDQKGQVADVKINNQKYSVGFEAMSPEGRTNLTPEEARKRSLTLGGIQEIERRPDVEGSVEAKGSPMERLTGLKEGWVGDYLDRKFSGKAADDTATAPAPTAAPIGVTTTPSKDIRVGDLARNPYDTQIGNPQRPTSLTDLSRNPYDTQKSNYVPQTHAEANNAPVGLMRSYGDKRPNAPNESIENAVQQSVGRALGPGYTVIHTSGQEGDLPQYGSNRHKTGNAVDYKIKEDATGRILDVNNPEDRKKLEAVAHTGSADFGIKGVGIGTNYMGAQAFHFDQVTPGKGQDYEWGDIGNANQQSLIAARGMYGIDPPVPTPRPTTPDVAGLGISQPAYAGVNPLDPVGNSLDPIKSTSVFDQIQPNTESYAKNIVSQGIAGQGRGVISEDISNASPAKMAALGLTPRSDAQISQISKAFAGELSPQQLEGIKNGDPVARAEYASMIATAENRAKSDYKGGSLDKVFDPSQYMSMSAANLGTTTQNYSLYKDALEATARDYYAGNLKPGSFDYSSYYNSNIADPSWGAKMSNTGIVGDHKFGTLPEYGPNQTFQDQRNAMAAAQKADPGGFTGVKDYSGSGYSSKLDSPSETSGIGRGSSLSGESSSGSSYSARGGQNSPSETSGIGRGSALSGESSSGYSGTSSGSSGNNSGTSTGGGGGQNASGSSSGAQGRSDGSHNSSGSTKSGSSGNNSGTSTGSGGGQNASGSSAGAQGRSDGEH